MVGPATSMARIAAIRALLLAAASAAALAASPPVAFAQSVNYGALEELYGEPVTTSVTGKPQKASDAPANLEIITQDDIRRSGANNIPDILRFVTGLDIRRYGAAQADVAIHGYNQPSNPRLLVLVNGRQVYIDTYGYVAWSAIPVQLEEIRQIEVVKGPNTALFGFNAASGVINIITYDPLFDQVNAGTLRYGSQNLLQGSAVATIHPGDNAGVRMSVGSLHQDEYGQAGKPPFLLSPRHDPALGAFAIDSKVRIAPGLEVTLEATTSTVQLDEQIPSALNVLNTYHTNSIKAGVIADTALGTFAINAYRNWLGAALFTGVTDTVFTNTVNVLQASDTLRLSTDHIIRISLEYRNNASTSTAVYGGTIGYSVYSAAGMWDWQITPSLAFTNSVRMDYLTLDHSGVLLPGTGLTNNQYNSATIAQPSFNSGLVYKLTDLDTVRLTIGRGLQVPSLIDFGLQTKSVSPFIPSFQGSPTLQPTAVWNAEMGYDHSISAIGSTLRSSVFIQRNDNLLTSGLSTFPHFVPGLGVVSQSQNIGHSDAVGGELGIKGQAASGFRWNASYAVIKIMDDTTINKIAITTPQNYQDGTPTNVVILGAGYTWQKLEIDAQSRWQSRFTDYRLNGTGLTPVYVSDYVTLMARVGYNLTDHVIIALTGQQFNVPKLLQSAGPPVERSVIASLTAHF